MRLAVRLCPDLLGSYSALPNPLAVKKGREGMERKELAIWRKRKGKEEKD